MGLLLGLGVDYSATMLHVGLVFFDLVMEEPENLIFLISGFWDVSLNPGNSKSFSEIQFWEIASIGNPFVGNAGKGECRKSRWSV